MTSTVQSKLEHTTDNALTLLASAVEKHPVAANTPGVLLTAWTWVVGLPLNHIVAVLTIVWLSLQIAAFVWVRVREFFKGKK